MTEIITGPLGRAWILDIKPQTSAHRAGLPTWILDVPSAHPVWSQYALSLIHLREIPGVPKPVLYNPKATHGVHLWALNPDIHMRPGDGPKPRMLLTPQNFVGQFGPLLDDELAVAKSRATADAVVQGRLSPDTDFCDAAWKALFPFHPYRPTRAQYMAGLRA